MPGHNHLVVAGPEKGHIVIWIGQAADRRLAPWKATAFRLHDPFEGVADDQAPSWLRGIFLGGRVHAVTIL
jgi:hypothetical protein